MKLVLIIILTLVINFVYSQDVNLTGKYISDSNYLISSDSSLDFKYGNLYGFGLYKIKKDEIIIQTISKNHNNSVNFEIDSILNSKYKFIIKVINPSNSYPLTTFITVKKINHRKVYMNFMTDDTIPILFENYILDTHENKVVIISNGIDCKEILLKDIISKSIKVNLTKNKTLENKKVTFKIIKNKTETIIIGPFIKLTRIEKRLYGLNHFWPWKKRSKCHHELVPIEYRK